MYDVIVFDLDGTLTDPGEGITASVSYALEQMGLPVPERQELYKFIGPPIYDSFTTFYGFDEEQTARAVKYYREHYGTQGLWGNEVYEGIPQLLAKLKAAGKQLLVATSKPEVFAIQILERFDLKQYFDLVAGSTLDSSRVKKGDVINYALSALELEPGPTVIMVGDREHDVLGARQAGLDCIGVLFGYGDEPELRKAGAVQIAATVSDLERLLLA